MTESRSGRAQRVRGVTLELELTNGRAASVANLVRDLPGLGTEGRA